MTREKQLEELGFERNDDQQSYCLAKYDKSWYIDFHNIKKYNSYEWNLFILNIGNDVLSAEKEILTEIKRLVDLFKYRL